MNKLFLYFVNRVIKNKSGQVFTDPMDTFFNTDDAETNYNEAAQDSRLRAEAEQQKQEQMAETQRQEAKAEQARIEEKYGLSPGEMEREQRTFDLEKQQQSDIQRRLGLSGEQLLAEEGGGLTNQLANQIYGRLGQTGEQLYLQEGGLPGQQYYNRITGTDQDILANELELVRQQVNQEANRRGVFGGTPEGGIRFENLGRAGIELAIGSARERMAQQQALAGQFINMAQSARSEAGIVGERSLGAKEQARAEMERFLAGQQQAVGQSQGRSAQVGLGAAGVGTQRLGLAEQFPATRAFSAFDESQDILGSQAANSQANSRANLAMIGQLGATAAGAAFGGPLGASIGSNLFGGAQLLPGGQTSLRTKGMVDDSLLGEDNPYRIGGSLPRNNYGIVG